MRHSVGFGTAAAVVGRNSGYAGGCRVGPDELLNHCFTPLVTVAARGVPHTLHEGSFARIHFSGAFYRLCLGWQDGTRPLGVARADSVIAMLALFNVQLIVVDCH